ncbi:MAG: hypothetical protein JJE12_08425 [Anaerolineales bacterium]|nr:hypothetical protein [Anaerolineales bacterium]
MENSQSLIISLDSNLARLDNAGGKATNLSKLLRSGFPVPPGVIITTAAYRDFVNQNSFSSKIEELTSNIDPKDNRQLEDISTQIRDLFEAGQISSGFLDQLQAACKIFDNQPLAVRSSATAEDLPGISFAGQQDTFLNITNRDDFIEAVVSSWSSLWTARAIGYRTRYNIPQDQVAMAVILQEMVPSLSSGVLFTANPLTGSRLEMVIDATFGVGEALVSGQVEPDHYLIDGKSKIVIERILGSKAIAMYTAESGGLKVQEVTAQDETVLLDEEILELAELGLQIAELFEFPQDIEWAIASDQIFILQSRPVTTLFPLPVEATIDHLRAYLSFAAIQGVLEPITPLGQDAMRWLFAGGASLFGFDYDHSSQPLIKNAGERLWMDISNALRNPLGSFIMRNFVAVVDPGMVKIFGDLLEQPGNGFGGGNLRLSTLRRMLRFMLPFLNKVFVFIRSPQGKAEAAHQLSQAEISRLIDKYPYTPGTPQGAQEILDLFREIRAGFTFALPYLAAPAGGGMLPLVLLIKISRHLTGSNQLALEITRGLPNNVTTEMDLELWKITRQIKSDERAIAQFAELDTAQLAEHYAAGQMAEVVQSAIEGFLETYGMRGLGEIDLGRKRFREDPTYIIEILLNYLNIDDPALAPDVIFQQGKLAAGEAIKRLQSFARATFAGRIKSALIGYLAVRVRALAGLRESPKFHIIQLMGIIRQGLLVQGQQLVDQGKLEFADDIGYFYYEDLEQLAKNSDQDWHELISQRKDRYNTELFRKQIPRLLLSDGRAFYDGVSSMESQAGKMIGSPVSPGLVEGKVRVVVNPLKPGLLPGEILVCRGTDPAWTPLFLTAGGLIMEVGGMMTHGAIVAREYGIPAVVGVSQATEVLHDGQRIQLNGSNGEIILLDI